MIQRYVGEEGESFSMMSYSPYQLDDELDIPVDKICTKVEILSSKFTEIYTSYIEAFAVKMAFSTGTEEEGMPEDYLQHRTLH